jgi:polyhydroxyalkanoate synthesis repressor PhaR
LTCVPQRVINRSEIAAMRHDGRKARNVIRLIKRYGSRKLYDTEESRYVSLEEIGAWVREGQRIRVVDNKTDDDVTAQTLTQVILEDGKRGASLPPSEVLHELIRRGGKFVSGGVEQLNESVGRLLEAGLQRVGPLREVREETDLLRKRLEELEASLERIEGESGKRDEEGTKARGNRPARREEK